MNRVFMVVALLLLAGCSKPPAEKLPLQPTGPVCETPAPRRPDAELVVAQQSVRRSGIWRTYPGWTIPVALDGSYRATLSIPTTDGFRYDPKAFQVKAESYAWGIAEVRPLPAPENVGAPLLFELFLIPTQPESKLGVVASLPARGGVVRMTVAGVTAPDGKPLSPFVLWVMDDRESMPACPDAFPPNM